LSNKHLQNPTSCLNGHTSIKCKVTHFAYSKSKLGRLRILNLRTWDKYLNLEFKNTEQILAWEAGIRIKELKLSQTR
jgi:hypothetical protein